MNQLDKFFNPKSIAVIGANTLPNSVGYSVFKNLVGNNFVLYPINNDTTIQSVIDIPTYQSVIDVPGEIDLAVIATPAFTVPAIVEQCGIKWIKAVIIISAGFKEIGKDGEALENNIVKTAKKYGIRIIGPNCLGILVPHLNLNASFSRVNALPGSIAFISQSGALGTAILDWSLKQNVGLSHFISIGTMLDVTYHDLIDYLNHDPHTQSIIIYMESLREAKKFLKAARAFTQHKPIIILKVWRSEEGAKAAKSHTGSITGNDDIFQAAFQKAGILRVDTLNDFFNLAQGLNTQLKPTGNKLCIITNAGGPGVISTDALIRRWGVIAPLSENTMHALNALLPHPWSHNNPIDILGDATDKRFSESIKICLDESQADAILVILTPQDMTDATAIAKELIKIDKKWKMILAVWMGWDQVQEGKDILNQAQIPTYTTPEDAIDYFMHMYTYNKNLSLIQKSPSGVLIDWTLHTDKNKDILMKVVTEKRSVLTEAEAKQFFSNYGIPIAKSGIAHSEKEAEKISTQIGFPVVMKILSPDIIHKTDVGWVILDIANVGEAKKAYLQIMSNVEKLKANIHGVFIEQKVFKKFELLIGCKKDPVFGPAIVFGMGWTAVEIFKDTNIALAPLDISSTKKLIEKTKIATLLKGYRGMPWVNMDELESILHRFSALVMDFPEIAEIDINPFVIDEQGGVILDAKIILSDR